MARVVCRVHRSDEQQLASMAWSEGPDEFPKYHLDGQLYRALQETAAKVREKLGHVVKDYVDEAPEEVRRTTAYGLAVAGFELYQQFFWPVPEDQRDADDVRQWLTELRDRDEVESLELVVDSPWSIPWNAVYDEEPDKAGFLEGPSDGQQWKPFWGIRYRLAASRGGGSPMRRTAILDTPRVLLVGDSGDPELRDVVADLRAFAAEHELTFVDCLEDLEQALQRERPDLLYWLSHAEPAALVLGSDEISASQLMTLLRKPGVLSGLAFLNCCGTAVASDTGSFLDTLRNVGFSGLIGTEQITHSKRASRLGLDFLRAFLLGGEPAGEVLRRLRREAAPLGLVYGTYCPPLLRVRQASANKEAVVVSVAPAGDERAAPAVALAQTKDALAGESAVDGDSDVAHPLALASNDPAPAMIALVTDEIERLLAVLPERYLNIALKKPECLSVREIAQESGVPTATVERRLRIIRNLWEKELGETAVG